MSKLFLLLLLVAAAYAYPTSELFEDEALDSLKDFESEDLPYYEEEEEELEQFLDDFEEDESTWDILKKGFGKIFKKNKEDLRKKLLNWCSKQKDLKEDVQEEDEEPKKGKLQGLLNKFKEFREKVKAKVAEKNQKVKEQIKKMKENFCNRLKKMGQKEDVEEDDGDDEERGWGSKLGKWGKKVMKKAVKKMKQSSKKLMKSGLNLLKKNICKITPMECEGNTCKSSIDCVSMFKLQAQMTLQRSNKKTELDVALLVNDVPKLEKRIKMGDVPNCVNAGGAIGKLCIKGLEGKGKSSKGEANINFCLVVLAESHGVGCKFCASKQNGKFKVKMSPKMFAGAFSDDGDIAEVSDNGEDAQGLLGPDEYEID